MTPLKYIFILYESYNNIILDRVFSELFTRPRKIFLGRVETLIITKFENFLRPVSILS